jgi:hypothetical protein
MRGWLWVPVVSLAFAGCLDGGGDGAGGSPGDDAAEVPFDASILSPKLYDILPPEEVWVQTSGDLTSGETGIRLNNAVYRPDTNETVPVFINFSPYWSDSAMERGDAFAQYMIDEYVPRG